MPCYHPLKGFILHVNPDGTKKLKITSYRIDHVEVPLCGDGTVVCTEQPERLSDRYRVVREYIDIPCNHCWGCRLEYSRTWANRLMMELDDHQEAWFLTLTYDNEIDPVTGEKHVPITFYADPETGEAVEALTLRKRDWQLFMKRLRKEYDANKIRFFASGEYGSKTARPHYHAIVYGLHFEPDELKLYKRSYGGFNLYNSDRLNKVWNKGFVVIAEVSWDTCAYTARYVLKKAGGTMKEFYEKFNIEPEFCLMSRKPGIARNYFERNKDQIYAYDRINLKTEKRGISSKPPAYFDKLFDQIDHERIAELKENRKIASERKKALELAGTDLPYLDYLAVKEAAAIERQKILLRRNFHEEENATRQRQKDLP